MMELFVHLDDGLLFLREEGFEPAGDSDVRCRVVRRELVVVEVGVEVGFERGLLH